MQPNTKQVYSIKDLYPRSLNFLTIYLQSLVRGRLWLKVIIGMVLGIATGILIGPTVGIVEPAVATLIGDWLAFPGKLFLALIQVIVIPWCSLLPFMLSPEQHIQQIPID